MDTEAWRAPFVCCSGCFPYCNFLPGGAIQSHWVLTGSVIIFPLSEVHPRMTFSSVLQSHKHPPPRTSATQKVQGLDWEPWPLRANNPLPFTVSLEQPFYFLPSKHKRTDCLHPTPPSPGQGLLFPALLCLVNLLEQFLGTKWFIILPFPGYFLAKCSLYLRTCGELGVWLW